LAVTGWLAAAPASAATTACPGATVTTTGTTTTCIYGYSGTQQTFTVPARVTSATFTLDGASGGSSATGTPGGNGGQLTATLPVTPGQAYRITVGGAAPGGTGTPAAPDGSANGGENGGGTGGTGGTALGVPNLAGGGGGASDVRTDGPSLSDWVLVAAGGGGAGGTGTGTGTNGTGGAAGGAGGASSTGGAAGAGGADLSDPATAGGGGGQAGCTSTPATGCSNGGTGGISIASFAGSAGTPGQGGAGARSGSGGDGGGGGGGYYGGGGGGSGFGGGENGGGGGGGGGGSSYATSSASLVTVTDGVNSGNGQITISYTQPVATVPGAPAIGTATAGNGQATVTFTPPASDGGSAITSYTVTATDHTNPANGGQTATGTTSPITVTGLTNGDSYTFTMTATNPIGTGPASAPSNPVTPIAPLAIITTRLPAATFLRPYQATLAATGGTAPYTWKITSGRLPLFLHLNPTTGVISGLPVMPGRYPLTITVADSEHPAVTVTKTFTLTVNLPALPLRRPSNRHEPASTSDRR
jgi:hypothetical protein